MRLFISILTFIFIIFSGCGVVLDPYRISGRWQLTEVNFYTTNNALDTTNTYIGTDSETPGSKNPVFGEFFDYTASKKPYNITFKDDNSFSVDTAAGSNVSLTDFILNENKGEWYINQFDNSITIYVASNDTASGFWRSGFKIVNYWSMPDYNTLEITIKASDVGKSNFNVRLSDKTIKVFSMKGIFTKK